MSGVVKNVWSFMGMAEDPSRKYPQCYSPAEGRPSITSSHLISGGRLSGVWIGIRLGPRSLGISIRDYCHARDSSRPRFVFSNAEELQARNCNHPHQSPHKVE
jgi:hypothetical protein